MLADDRFYEAVSDLQKRFQHPVETPLKPDERLQPRPPALAACTQEGFELPQERDSYSCDVSIMTLTSFRNLAFLAFGTKKAGQVKSAEGVHLLLTACHNPKEGQRRREKNQVWAQKSEAPRNRDRALPVPPGGVECSTGRVKRSALGPRLPRAMLSKMRAKLSLTKRWVVVLRVVGHDQRPAH